MGEKIKTYRVYNLLQKYFPNTLSLIDKKYDFSILDERYKQIIREDTINNFKLRETNIVDFTIYCEQKNKFHLELAKFLDGLVKEAIETLSDKHKKRLRNTFKGKFTNYSSLNYLNPFGEIISLLTILKNSNFNLLEIEHKIPNMKSLDFLFETTNNRKIAVEVINLHPKDNYNSILELKKDLLGKIKSKIDVEIDNIQSDKLQFTWTYLPVLWSFDLISLLSFKEFFEKIENTLLKLKDKDVFLLGFTSFIQHIDDNSGERKFGYGSITKLLNKLTHSTNL